MEPSSTGSWSPSWVDPISCGMLTKADNLNWNLTGRSRCQCVLGWTKIDTLLGTARYRFGSPKMIILAMYTRRERPMCRSTHFDEHTGSNHHEDLVVFVPNAFMHSATFLVSNLLVEWKTPHKFAQIPSNKPGGFRKLRNG